MASTISGASLANIYNRLNNAPTYHPLEAKTFSDWAVEAGDILTINRGDNNEESYQSPVLTSRMVWRGTPQTTLNSSGSKEREAVSRVSRRKYGRGGSGMRNDQVFFKTFTDAYEGLYSYFEVTSSRMYTHFEGLYDGLSSDFEVTRSRMYVDFSGLYDGLSASFEVTRSRMYVDFDGFYDGLSSEFETTRSRLYYQVSNYYTNLRSRIIAESDRLSLIVEGTGENQHIKPAQIQAAIDAATGQSKIDLSADHINLDGNVVTSALYGEDVTIGVLQAGGIENQGSLSLDINAPIMGIDGGTSAFCGDIIVDAEVDQNTNTLTLTKLDGSTVTFSKAASTKVSGSWSGGVLTVSADDNGENTYQRSFAVGTVDWQADKKAAYVYGNVIKTSGGSTYVDEADAFSLYVPTTESYNEGFAKGRNFYLYSQGWSSGKLTIGAKDTSTDAVISGKTIERTVIGGTPTWDGGTVTVPIRAYYGNTPPTYENTNASITLNLSIDNDGNNSVKLKYGSTDTGYTFNHGKYTAGQKSVTPSISWPVGWTVTASNPYDNTKTASIGISMSHGSDSIGHYIELHSNETNSPLKAKKTISLNTGSVSSGSRTVKVNFGGSDILSATISDYSNGQSAAGISTSWGTGSGANVLTVERALSSSTKSATFTVTAGAPTGSYNSSTHKYVLTGTALVNNTHIATGSGGTGTEAYEDGKTDGAKSAGNSAWFHYASGPGSNHQGTLSANSYVSIGYVNAAGTTVWKDDTTWLTPAGGNVSEIGVFAGSTQWTGDHWFSGGGSQTLTAKANVGGSWVDGNTCRIRVYNPSNFAVSTSQSGESVGTLSGASPGKYITFKVGSSQYYLLLT